MMNATITDNLQLLVSKAKEQIIAGEEFHPILYHGYQNIDSAEISAFVMPVNDLLKNDETRRMLVGVSHEAARAQLRQFKNELICACLISDAFYSQHKVKPEHEGLRGADLEAVISEYPRPSKDPDRIEGLMICACTKTDKILTHHLYERRPGGIVFTESKEGREVAGYMSELFPQNLWQL